LRKKCRHLDRSGASARTVGLSERKDGTPAQQAMKARRDSQRDISETHQHSGVLLAVAMKKLTAKKPTEKHDERARAESRLIGEKVGKADLRSGQRAQKAAEI
jgi:hypothetical protein